jgi:hypothetical protein
MGVLLDAATAPVRRWSEDIFLIASILPAPAEVAA